MKIICVGRNYREHIRELNNETPGEPVIFMKPDTALVPKHNPVFLPPFSGEIHYETELVVRINRLGKAIPASRTREYFNEIGLGLDLTARDIQKQLKAQGLPWEKAKAFDFSAVVSEHFIPVTEFEDINKISFHLKINGKTVQAGNSADMIFPIAKLIEHVSQYFTLRTGDLIFTGTPAGVGKLNRNDLLEGYIGKQLMFKKRVK